MPVIAVFGSGIVRPQTPEYQLAYEVGKHLAEAGFSVMTGGYQGIMEGVSRGASEAGGGVIGVTAHPIEMLRRVRPNKWVNHVIPYNTLRERLLHLILNADGYVVMPGGVGTFAELMLVWDLLRVQEVPPRPLVCVGPYWETMLAPLRESIYVTAINWEYLSFVVTPEAVVTEIKKGL